MIKLNKIGMAKNKGDVSYFYNIISKFNLFFAFCQ